MAKKHEYKRREPKPKVLVYNKTGFDDGCQAQGQHIMVQASNPAMKIIGNREIPGDLAESMCEQMPDTFTLDRAEAFTAMGMVDAVTAVKVGFLDGMTSAELVGALKFSGYDGGDLKGTSADKLKELAESWAKGIRLYPEGKDPETIAAIAKEKAEAAELAEAAKQAAKAIIAPAKVLKDSK